MRNPEAYVPRTARRCWDRQQSMPILFRRRLARLAFAALAGISAYHAFDPSRFPAEHPSFTQAELEKGRALTPKDEDNELPSSDEIDEVCRRVKELSDGSLRKACLTLQLARFNSNPTKL